ncbi:MAG: hypothetical protein RR277_09085, partial [Rikenellaceae bacterium]
LVPPVVNTDEDYARLPDAAKFYSSQFIDNPTAASVQKGIGDPCRLVGQTQAQIATGEFNKTWRLPKAGEIDGLWNNPRIISSSADGGVYIGIRGVNERIAFFSFYTTSIDLLTGPGITTPFLGTKYLTANSLSPHIHDIHISPTPRPNDPAHPEIDYRQTHIWAHGLSGRIPLGYLYRIRCIRQ